MTEASSYTLILFHETDRAYLVGEDPADRETDKAFWLPSSQVEMDPTLRKGGVEWADFEIPEWLADEKGLDASLSAGFSSDGDLWEEF